jgi:hypothetical protein
LADLLTGVGTSPVDAEPARVVLPSLFASTEVFVTEALREVFDDAPEDAVGLRREEGLLALDAPDDLEQRMSDLPRSYLAAHRGDGERLRLKLTFDRALAQRKLEEARRSKTTVWPDIGYVSDIHPVVDWLIDKLLVRLGRQQAPVLSADVAVPVFLVQGVYCNQLGQPTVVEWMAVSGLPGQAHVGRMDEALRAAGVGPAMTNRAVTADLDRLQRLVPAAVDAARHHLERRRSRWDAEVAEPVRAYRARLRTWEQDSLGSPAGSLRAVATRRLRAITATATEQRNLAALLETTGEPLLRVLAVLDGSAGEY